MKYYRFMGQLARPWKYLVTLHKWEKVLRHDYDFDAHGLYAIIEHKLKLVQQSLKRTNIIVKESEDMRALNLAIKLINRLSNDRYEDPHHKRHDRKWGELSSKTVPIPGSTNVRLITNRPKAITDDQQDLESAEYMLRMDKWINQKEREKKWFYAILVKYVDRWWD